MGSAAIKSLEGFASRGNEVPFLYPHDIGIVGVDVKETDENWFAFCPRAGEELEPEWIDDIRKNGVRQPVDVYKDGNAVVMLDGRRRVTAARIVYDEQVRAGVPEKERISVRVNIHHDDPMKLFGYNVGSENRKARTPLQRAQLMRKAQKFGADDKALAQMFNCSVPTVKNTLALFDMASDVQRAVDRGELALRDAIKLVDKPREEQKKILTALKEADVKPGAETANAIRQAKRGEPVQRDKSKMRSRNFLEKWRGVVKKRETSVKADLDEVLKFILGGPVPKDATEAFKETLVEAGFRSGK